MSRSITDRIKINHYADLFGDDDGGVVTLPIGDLHPFPGHPFSVKDDEDMDRLCKSIESNGIVSPIIVRANGKTGYEIISGHRRTHAAKKIGLTEVPVIIKQMEDDEAIVSMVDSNLQRENILPSEKAFSYKMKIEALSRSKGRSQKVGQIVPQYKGKRSTEIVGEETGDNYKQVQRYVRLTELIPELLEMVDVKKMPMNAGVEISFIDKNKQKCLYGILEENGVRLSVSEAKKIKKAFLEKNCSKDRMMEILQKHTVDDRQLILTESDLSRYFPTNMSVEAAKITVKRLLEEWSRRGEV